MQINRAARGTLVTFIGDTLPPRDPNDDDDEDEHEEDEEDEEPAVIREPDDSDE
jgi:hypothetical protein